MIFDDLQLHHFFGHDADQTSYHSHAADDFATHPSTLQDPTLHDPTLHRHDNQWGSDPAHHDLGAYGPYDGFAAAQPGSWLPFHGVGNPIAAASYWQPQTENSCAVMAQADIIAAMGGPHLTESQAVQVVSSHGWYHDGTQPQDVGKLLNLYGIPTHETYDNSLTSLYDALQHGQYVMVGLNANEIWTPVHDPVTGAPQEQPVGGHVVWVTGMDQTPDGHVHIFLNDTGTPTGRIEEVDAADFLNAWHDVGNLMVTAPATHVQA